MAERNTLKNEKYSDVKWTHLNLLACRLFVQQLVQAHIKENIKALLHWPLWGNPSVTSGSPHKGPVTQNCFLFMTLSCFAQPLQLIHVRIIVAVANVFRHWGGDHRCLLLMMCLSLSIFLTQWGIYKISYNFQTTFSKARSWRNSYIFWLKFHWNFVSNNTRSMLVQIDWIDAE